MIDINTLLPQQVQLLYGLSSLGEFSIDKENKQVTIIKDFFYDKDYIEGLLSNIDLQADQYLEWYRNNYEDPAASMPIEMENFFGDIKKLLQQTIDKL